MGALLQPALRIEAHIEGGERRVVHLRTAAQEEQHVFLVGSFQRLAHTDWRGGNGGDLRKVNAAELLALRVSGEGMQGGLSNGTQQRLASVYSPKAAGCEYVPTCLHGSFRCLRSVAGL